MPDSKAQTGLVLTGGGARAAYQVGVLRAIAELTPRGAPSPFQVICGTSAGAINAAAVAAYAQDYRCGISRLVKIWANFHVNQVFRSDVPGVMKTGAHWLLSMMSVGFLGKRDSVYLLDRAPLEKMLRQYIRSSDIQRSIDQGFLRALSITASGYTSHESVSFFQGGQDLASWSRSHRAGSRASIGVDHLMASSAIPFIFAPRRVNREFFGDGSMRQIAPISPALHLGANRVLVIGNQQVSDDVSKRVSDSSEPTLGQIAAHALNSIFLNVVEADIERLQRINKTISLIPREKREAHDIALRHIDLLVISPSRDLGELAIEYAGELPRTIRILLRGIGADVGSGSALVSYLLFEKGYCRRLIRLGYDDALAKRDEVKVFLEDAARSGGIQGASD